MKSAKNLLILLLVCSLFLIISTEPIFADYPTKPIKVIVPYGAGGGTDVFTRVVSKYIDLEEPFIITNISGAGGKIGTMEAVSAKPDGYTLLAHVMAIVIGYYAGLYEEPITEKLDPIASLTTESCAISVKKDAPWNNIDELIKYAKENPGKVSWGFAGVGGTTHTTTAAFCDFTNIEVNYVPYPGAAQSTPALAGGHVDVLTSQPSEVLDIYKSGMIKILVTTGKERNLAIPEVPTLKEQGIDFVFTLWRGFFAPKGTPKEIISKLERALEKVTENEEFRKTLTKLNYGIKFLNSEEFAAKIKEDSLFIEKIAHIYK